MKNVFVKYPLKLIGIKVAFAFIFIMLLFSFSWLVDIASNWLLIYSIVMSLFYFSWVYGEAYQEATRDIRRKLPQKRFKGFLLGLISEIPSALILIVLLLVPQNAFLITHLVYIIWQAPFAGFMVPGGAIFLVESVNIWYFAVLLIIPVVTGVGYIMGLKKISFAEKYAERLVYQKKDKKTP